MIGKRDYALLLFYVYTGLRRNEVFSLRRKDLVEEDGKLIIKYKRKGGKWANREEFSHGRISRSAGAAGSGQSQPTEGHGDQPQHQGPGATDYSVAAAGTTVGGGQNQPAVDRGD